MLHRALQNIRDGLLGLAYPQECRVCGGLVESWDDGVACAECWDDPNLTKILTGSVCAKCGAAMTPHTINAECPASGVVARLCGMCSSIPIGAARACGAYSGALEASILFLKTAPHICPRLRSILRHTFAEYRQELRSDVVVPVPLHRLRERQRGFNQAAIIAGLIAGSFNLPFDSRSLSRIKPTERHRAGMDAKDRTHSVERAFKIATPCLIAGATVLLVDDVYTTGSTICAASQALIEAGAQRVNVMTIARAGTGDPTR